MIDVGTIKDAIEYVNLVLIPVFVWIVRVERRLMRVETILDERKEKGGTEIVQQDNNQHIAVDS